MAPPTSRYGPLTVATAATRACLPPLFAAEPETGPLACAGMTAAANETFPLAGRPVRRVGFGAMQLPGPGVFGPPPDREAARGVLRRAVELGVNHIDTAQYYGPDVANELIHEALHPYPEDLVIVTKVGGKRDAEGAWLPALSPAELRGGVQDNLRSLEVDRVDVVNLRLFDEAGSSAFDDQLDAM